MFLFFKILEILWQSRLCTSKLLSLCDETQVVVFFKLWELMLIPFILMIEPAAEMLHCVHGLPVT